MRTKLLFFASLLFFVVILPSAFGDTLAFFQDGTKATATDADRNLAGVVTGLQGVGDLSVAFSSRTASAARATFNGNIDTGNATTDNWLAAAMTGVPTAPTSGSAYLEINLVAEDGYAIDLERIGFDWQVANNTNATAIGFSCAVFVDYFDGNGFVQVGDMLANSAKKTGSAAGFGIVTRGNLFTPTAGNKELFYATIRIAVAASATDSGYAQFFQNIKITGTVKLSTKPRPEGDSSIKLADNGAWTWFNDPRAFFHNGVLYTGYVNMSNGKSAVNACKVETGTYTKVVESTLVDQDDHNNAGILPLLDGRLLVMMTRHSKDNQFEIFISKDSVSTPATPQDWNASVRFSPVSADSQNISYQNPFQLSAENGRIYNFTRATNWNPCFSYSDDAGATWSLPATHFIKNGSGSVRPYAKYASNYKDRIDILYTDGHPRNENNSLYHLYVKAQKVYRTDGTLIKTFGQLPLDHANAADRGSVIYQYSTTATTDYNDHIPAGRAWCHDLVYDKAGNPVCVFTVRAGATDNLSARIFYYYAYYTPEKGWQKRFIAQAGRPLYSSEGDYAGGISLDPENPNVVYISTNAKNPFDLTGLTAEAVPLVANSRYEIYRGVISGSISDNTFGTSWEALTANSPKDNLRPYVPRNSPYGLSVVYFYGTYATYTNINAEVRGIFKDKKASFAGWTADNGFFGGDAAPNADPNRTGIENLTAYAFGIEPAGAITDVAQAKLPHMENLADGTPVFRFKKNNTLPDIDYVPQTSTDLQSWVDATSIVEAIDSGMEIHSTVANSGELRRFYRVKIVQK